jgi:hypothetical protein
MIGGEHAEPARPLVDAIDVVDREEYRLRTQCRCETAFGDIDNGDDDAAAVEVVARSRWRWPSIPRSSQ